MSSTVAKTEPAPWRLSPGSPPASACPTRSCSPGRGPRAPSLRAHSRCSPCRGLEDVTPHVLDERLLADVLHQLTQGVEGVVGVRPLLARGYRRAQPVAVVLGGRRDRLARLGAKPDHGPEEIRRPAQLAYAGGMGEHVAGRYPRG